MTDLKLEILADGQGADFVLLKGDLVLDESLVTPVMISLFSDARAEEDDPIPGDIHDDPRGFWAETAGDPFGSKLWILDAARLSNVTVEQAREWTETALAWLVEDEIARSVTVTTRRDRDHLVIDIQIERGDAPAWEKLWDATAEETVVQLEDATVRLLAA